MTEVQPFIQCVDYWPQPIPEASLAAYKQLIEEQQIRKHHVIYDKSTGRTVVEYYAIAPHEWILETLAKRARMHKAPAGEQIQMEVET